MTPSQPGAVPARSLPLKLSSKNFQVSSPSVYEVNGANRVIRFSDEFPGAYFVKLDVDEVSDVAQELGIRAMPTFLIFKNGEKIQEVVGANPKALLAGIQEAVKMQ